MEEPREELFFATVLRDPLSEVTRTERVYLLGTSVVGIAILKTGLIPTRITALGIEFERANQELFLLLLGLVVLYFLVAFVIYAASDFLAWWEGYQAALAEISLSVTHEEMIERVAQRTEESEEGETLASLRRTRRTGLAVATVRALLEYLLPVLVGAYAAYILIL